MVGRQNLHLPLWASSLCRLCIIYAIQTEEIVSSYILFVMLSDFDLEFKGNGISMVERSSPIAQSNQLTKQVDPSVYSEEIWVEMS